MIIATFLYHKSYQHTSSYFYAVLLLISIFLEIESSAARFNDFMLITDTIKSDSNYKTIENQ